MQEANGSSAQGLGGEAEQQEGFGMFVFISFFSLSCLTT
jgi:hypothetical protein